MDELKYERVEGDLYGIAERIKEIDPSYYILRERRSGRLEVHSSAQRGSTYALSLPRKRLDARDLEHVRRTRSDNISRLMRETERENELLERAASRERKRASERALERALKGYKEETC